MMIFHVGIMVDENARGVWTVWGATSEEELRHRLKSYCGKDGVAVYVKHLYTIPADVVGSVDARALGYFVGARPLWGPSALRYLNPLSAEEFTESLLRFQEAEQPGKRRIEIRNNGNS